MDFYSIFLDYFKKCVKDNSPIELEEMIGMANGKEQSANSALEELRQKGIINLKPKMNVFQPGTRLENFESITLTEKGLNEIKQLIFKGNPEFESIEANKSDRLLEKIIEKEKNRISQLSAEDKNKEIIEKILSYFKFLNSDIQNYPDGKIKSSEIKEKIKNIVSKYYASIAAIKASQITNNMKIEGYITFIYKKNAPEKYKINNLLTSKGASYLEQLEKDYEEKLENYCKENDIKFPDPICSNVVKFLEIINNYPTQKALEVVQNIYKNFSNEQLAELIKNANIAVRAAQSIPNINTITFSPNVIDEVKEDKDDKEGNETKGNNKEKTYTFEGILGQNCGDYITIDDSNKDDRLPDRIIHEKTGQHFIVKNGIKVLRGFAKASDLYLASEPDKKNYQREEDDVHLNELSEFISEMNPSGKYLPELTFVARGGYELCRPDWGKKLTGTQLGFFKNSNYYQLHLNGTKLYRIDGNHRSEALQKLSTEQKEYYIPFAIILMGKQVLFDDTDPVESSLGLEFSGNYGLVDNQDEKKIIDMEAFLFYFLNAKAKRLTTEENYRGLISSDWQNHEIEIANKNIILLQHLNKLLEDNILHNDFCNNEPLKQISEILEKINEDIELNKFVKIVKIMNNLLAADRWQNLKKFEFYCQLIFYVAYKHEDETECKQILNNLEYWVEKYNFDNATFDNPILLYNNAQKTNNVNPINVFVAMPYYSDGAIDDFNDQFRTLKDELEDKYPELIDRFNIYEIMKHRGYAIDIQQRIIDQIKSANIFIADISECICQKGSKKVDSHANPNVMYELGIAQSQAYTEIILLKNKKDKIEVPSDIITKYHNKFEFDNKVAMRKKLFEAIENILKDKFEII